MKKYKVYFRIYGKGIAKTVEAGSKAEAKRIVQEAIIFDKIESLSDPFSGDPMDVLKSVFGIK